MRSFGHFASRNCARFGVNECVCIMHGWSDYERFWPFYLVHVCEVWGQCVCVSWLAGLEGVLAILLCASVRALGSVCVCVCVCHGLRIMSGSGHLVVCKCARRGVNVCAFDMGGLIMRGFGRFA